MTRTSVLADALNAINNAEKTGKRQVLIRPSSKVIIKFLSVMQKHGYIGEFEYIDDHRSGKIVVQLNGRLNKCGVIQPRFNVKIGDIERWTDNLLPARQFGYVILTTSAGIMDHEEARRKHVSGKILGFAMPGINSVETHHGSSKLGGAVIQRQLTKEHPAVSFPSGSQNSLSSLTLAL
ncbi:hypothetical protein B5S28_g1305 [[Candida] boidinii]|nr:hypothetical protein B5S28_g1305 [[Candida] boidinii]OWB60764.1 hypothetical protein B5S29_g1645 [[Candida] boidinii]OWB70848.1 hypothetical protein B5S31_g529 [[Candida] boidinii]OWB76737.1 hypothetical protein B5S32_g892 [[Candida] boidinii]